MEHTSAHALHALHGHLGALVHYTTLTESGCWLCGLGARPGKWSYGRYAHTYTMIQDLDCISSDVFCHESGEEVRAEPLPVAIEDDLIIFMLCDDERSFKEVLTRRGDAGMFSAEVCMATACWRDSGGKYLRILLESGLDPNSRISRLTVRDTFPTTVGVYECRLQITIEEHTKRETNKCAVHLAAGVGNVGALRELLSRSNTDYNLEDSHQNTALHYVACARYRDTVSKGRFDECAQLLLNMPAINVNIVNKDDFTPVQMAARCGNFLVLKVLLGHKEVKTIPKDSNKNTLLHKLSENPDAAIGNNELIEICVILLLSRKDIDINARNSRGNTALHLAARFSNLSVMKTLMKYVKTDVFASKRLSSFSFGLEDANTSKALDLNQKEKRGYTPAHLALVSKNQDGALTMLRRGSSIWETCNNGRCLLDDIAPDTLEAFLDSCLDHSGEYEFKDLPLELLTGTSHVILVIFVLIVSLAMLNLLNGLAVSDTQAIKEKALFLSVVSTIRLIMLFEDLYISSSHKMCRPCGPSNNRLKYFALFPEASRDDTCFEVMPNVKVTRTALHSSFNLEYVLKQVHVWFVNLFRWVAGSDMDSDIVQAAMDILNRRHESLCLETLTRKFDEKINEYEMKLASLGRRVEETNVAVDELGKKTSAALCHMEREIQMSSAEILSLLRTLHKDA
ncbi:hypothetical protein PR048_026831 [Dryococelus australis]|uniref:Transient receptor potential cation channel subfamily A member 1 n=1 Tax=Dryococelus australis TaxID=614101 RepID=A0ABQ9GME5_9NEOP|nr:hypothetical protein PR048_026831 [Dryococelus australis]